MQCIVRAFSILGLALVAALVHSWFVPISIAAGGNDDAARQRARELMGEPSGDPSSGANNNAGASSGSTGGSEDSPTDPGAGEQPDQGGTADVQEQPADDGASDPIASGERVTDSDIHLTLAELRTLFERHIEPMTGEVLLIDARGIEGAYEEGHILGAEHITTDMIRDDEQVLFMGAPMSAQERIQMAPLDQMVVIYCGGGDCDESENVRTLLVDSFGMTNVWIFEAGYPAWESAGLPTIEGSTPFGG